MHLLFAGQSLGGVLGWSPTLMDRAGQWGNVQSLAQLEEFEPGARRGGWQGREPSRGFRDEDLFARLDGTGQALLRSQGGPGAGLALTSCSLLPRGRRWSPSSFECCFCAACTSLFP